MTTTLISTATLADLATSHPAASRVLHRHALDFCCGGRRALAEACSEKGVDAEAVLAEIRSEAQGAQGPRWDERPLAELADFIEGHYHARLRAELPELVRMAERVEAKHAEKASCPRGLRTHLSAVHEAVLDHLAKEEQILFPLIRSGRGPLASAPIHVMEVEHDDHAANLRKTRSLTADLTPPEQACATWRALYLRLVDLERELMEHIHLENNVLFRRALLS
jgi:regulator of cell morphogenesis and NO signaling